MDTKLATREIRLQEWAAIIQDQKNSGLVVDAYCKQHNLSRNAFYYWLRLIKKAALHASGIEFYELPKPKEKSSTVIPENNFFAPEAVIRINNLAIEVNGSTPKELLQALCEVAVNVK